MVFHFPETRLSSRRSIFSYFKVQRLISMVIRGHRWFLKAHVDGQYIDVGCGPNMVEGFYNIDWLWRPGVHACWDIRRGLPLKSYSVGGIFTEHCLEHIPFADCVRLVDEFYRVLKKGCYIRIIVPDAETYLKCYNCHLAGKAGTMPYEDGDRDRAMGLYTPVFSVNRIMRDHGHEFIYDYEIMQKIVSRAGFTEIKKRSLAEGHDPKLLNDTEARAVELLYLEARK